MRHAKKDGCAYILWDDYCDEALVVLFATVLRAAGWRTRVIGLRGARHTGRYGLVLVADSSLGEVLRADERAACIVAPCAPAMLIGQRTDARLDEFLLNAVRQDAIFVAEAAEPVPPWPAESWSIPPDPAQAIVSAHALVAQMEISA